MIEMEFINHTALVTGATGDIGREIVRQLHQNGANLVISGTNEDKLANLANELGERVIVKPCKLQNKDDCAQLVAGLPQIDILVCNAGIAKDNLALKMSDKDFEDVIAINLTANFILNREAIKKMIRAKRGRIINISSIVGYTGNPGQVNYCAAKAGLTGLTKSLAYEVAARNITVNCIAPGFIKSAMTDKLSDAQQTGIMQKIPMKRFGNPNDIAAACVFLSSDKARYITGQTIHINGGMAML